MVIGWLCKHCAKLATSRKPKLNPCPAIGCKVWAALPKNTTGHCVGCGIIYCFKGCNMREPMAKKRPNLYPKVCCNVCKKIVVSCCAKCSAFLGGTHHTKP